MSSAFQSFLSRHVPAPAPTSGLGGLVASKIAEQFFGLVLHAIRDQVVHLDQPSIDAVRAVNPDLAAELQALYDLLSSVPAPDSLRGLLDFIK